MGKCCAMKYIIHHSLSDNVTENLSHVSPLTESLGTMRNKINLSPPWCIQIDIPIQPDLILIELYDGLSCFIFLPSD